MKSAVVLPMLAVFVISPTIAPETTATVTGGRLIVEGPCARRVTIEPDSRLSGTVEIVATADHAEELAAFTPTSGAAARLRSSGRECWRPAFAVTFEPTLDLAVRVPAGFAIAIDEPGSATYRLGDVAGSLSVDGSGSVTLTAESATNFNADIAGSGRLAVRDVRGAVDIDISGSGSIDIDRAVAPEAKLDLSGSGRVRMRAGTIDRVALDISGSGSADFGGSVGEAKVTIDGSGSAVIGRLTGTIEQEISGSGGVTIVSR